MREDLQEISNNNEVNLSTMCFLEIEKWIKLNRKWDKGLWWVLVLNFGELCWALVLNFVWVKKMIKKAFGVGFLISKIYKME